MLRSETAAAPERLARALDGLRKYQEAPRDPVAGPMPAIAQAEGAMLRDYGNSSPAFAGEGDHAQHGGGAARQRRF